MLEILLNYYSDTYFAPQKGMLNVTKDDENAMNGLDGAMPGMSGVSVAISIICRMSRILKIHCLKYRPLFGQKM